MSDDGHDLRMPMVGAAAWLAGITAYQAGAWAALLWPVLGLTVLALAGSRLPAAQRRLLAAALIVAAAVAASTLLRHQGTAASPLAELASTRSGAELRGTVVSDPRVVPGDWGDRIVVRLRVHEVVARGTTYRLGATVVVLGGSEWLRPGLGSEVRVDGRLLGSEDRDVAALLTSRSPPVVIGRPDVWWRGAGAVRASIRTAVADRPDDQRSLVPALVVGDVSGMDPALKDDFRTTGLTHLTAVSGTNLTLLLGFVLVVARWCGVRGRWLHAVALLGIVGFILLTRTEPSVLRAAAMGLVGLFAMANDGRRRGMRALGVAVTGLLLVWPPLAVSAGFALSVLATAGIVLVGPPVTRALARWLPLVVAQAVAVPLAAQVAVTPVIAALSGEVSLVAVLANVLVAPVVGPATVLGLSGGLLGLVVPLLGRICGTLAGWCVAWVVAVAEWGARLPQASIGWGSGALALTALVVLCLVVVVAAPRLAGHPRLAIALSVGLLLVVLDVPGRAMPWRGDWPPPDWVMVACDVGQGDALAISVAPGSAVVVDAGPEPDAVADCLDRLGVREVPLVVLTHFHADHIDGLSGVLRGRRVGAIEVSALLDPPEAVDEVRRTAAGAGVPLALSPYGATRRIGEVTFQVLWPDLATPTAGPGDGSSANDGSVVVLVESRGLRLLLTGDVEPPGQAALARALPGLDIDVLKVPHHGSRHQDEEWLTSLTPDVALVSVGEANDYGHPAPALIDLLERASAEVARTDQHGDLAVVAGHDGHPDVTHSLR